MSTLSLAQPTKTLARKNYDVGYELYVARQPLTSCQTIDQRRGWLAANRAEAEAEFAAWCQQEADDYADWREDVEWLRRGC